MDDFISRNNRCGCNLGDIKQTQKTSIMPCMRFGCVWQPIADKFNIFGGTLMKKYVFILSLAAVMLLVLTACGNNNDSQDIEYVYETLIDETPIENEDNDGDSYDWIDLGIISIPSTWSYEFVETIYGGFFSISGEGDYLGRVRMSAGVAAGPNLEWRIESSLSHTSFLFDDGYVGYMMEYDYSIEWWRGGWSFSLPHHGLRTVFTDNEELILRIARSLTALRLRSG